MVHFDLVVGSGYQLVVDAPPLVESTSTIPSAALTATMDEHRTWLRRWSSLDLSAIGGSVTLFGSHLATQYSTTVKEGVARM